MQNAWFFHVSPTSGVPIYRQLMDQIRGLAASGRLKAGDALPSVRQVAETLEVNPMTVSKAYSLLERDGVIERKRGQGMHVRGLGGRTQSAKERQAKLVPVAKQLAVAAFHLALSKEQVLQIVADQLKELSDE